MIPHGVEIFLGLDPIDLRWGFERLSGIVQERIGHSARTGALFVFFGRRREAIKVLFFDGSGLCLFYKRLDRGTFRLPETVVQGQQSLTLTDRELDDLLEGIDLEAPRRRSRRRPPVH